MGNILCIDPGNMFSGWCIINQETYKWVEFGKDENEFVRNNLLYEGGLRYDAVVIEMIGHYGTGMPAGKEVFDTCIWIGRFSEVSPYEPELMLRKTVVTEICGNPHAKDANVIQALKDRFGHKGTISQPGFFKGFKADCWQAFALGVAYLEKKKRGEL